MHDERLVVEQTRALDPAEKQSHCVWSVSQANTGLISLQVLLSCRHSPFLLIEEPQSCFGRALMSKPVLASSSASASAPQASKRQSDKRDIEAMTALCHRASDWRVHQHPTMHGSCDDCTGRDPTFHRLASVQHPADNRWWDVHQRQHRCLVVRLVHHAALAQVSVVLGAGICSVCSRE